MSRHIAWRYANRMMIVVKDMSVTTPQISPLFVVKNLNYILLTLHMCCCSNTETSSENDQGMEDRMTYDLYRTPQLGSECHLDQECVGSWWPGASECGAVARCEDQRCVLPPMYTQDITSSLVREVELWWGEEYTRFWVEGARSEFELQRGLMCRSIEKMRDAQQWGMVLLFLGEELNLESEFEHRNLIMHHMEIPIWGFAFNREGVAIDVQFLKLDDSWSLPEQTSVVLEVAQIPEALKQWLDSICDPLCSTEMIEKLSLTPSNLRLEWN